MIAAPHHIISFTRPAKYRRLCLALVFCLGTVAAGAQVREYQLKAAFLFNFSQFVEWPSSSFAGPSSPFVIGVVGPNPFGIYLSEIVKGESIMGRQVVLQYFASEADIKPCHILFVNKINSREVLEQLQGQSILTVGDSGDFTHAGGVVQFYTEQNKIRFQINTSAARTARLNISSKLLRLAKIVD